MKWWRIKKRDADLDRELRSDLELEQEEQRTTVAAITMATGCRDEVLDRGGVERRCDVRHHLLHARRAFLPGDTEVAEAHVEEAAALVKERMEGAVELDVALRADIGWGANWAEAAPEGH